jgi:hypothetical protein
VRARLLATLVVAAVGAGCCDAARAAVSDPSCGRMLVVTRAGGVLYPLAHPFLREGSDSVTAGGARWVAGRDYVLDRLRGELRLLREVAPGETLAVHACWLLTPPPVELQLERYRPPAARGDAPRDSATAPSPPRPGLARDPSAAAPAGAALAITGNKTLAVDFGSNQDAFLRQSLDLAVSGTLAPDVRLTGVLSDRNTPLTAAGSTQDLQALDQVRLELSAPAGTAALGDVTVETTRGEFARVERRLQGVRGMWKAGGARFDLAAAGAPGEFHRLQIVGVEGRQGPYTLTDRAGQPGISVVAGSEVVTLDGVRLARGEGADYAIEYETARLTFTNRRPISSASRITVEYQYAVNRYRRNFAAAGGGWQGRDWHAHTQVLAEGDDRARALDVALDAPDRVLLAFAGDSARNALRSGVSDQGGDYDTVRVDTAGVVYVYAGPGAGRFAVSFAPVGAGRGDYEEFPVPGGIAYRFVGAGRGTHRVGRLLPLPESHLLWGAGGGGRVGPVSLELEGAVSRLDRNTFSALDDGDNLGGAARVRAGVEGETGPRWLGRTGLAVEARSVGRRFEPFGRLERPFGEEAWGLPAGADVDRQRRVEVRTFARGPSYGEIRLGAGALKTPAGFAGRRREASWQRDGALVTRLSYEGASGEQSGATYGRGSRDRAVADLRVRFGWLEPGVRAESDARRFPADSAAVGVRLRAAGAEIAGGRRLPVRAALGWEVRRDADWSAGGWVDRSETRIVRGRVETPETRAASAAVRYERRLLEPLADPRRTRSDLGSVRVRGEDRARGLSVAAGVELTSEGENRRERRVVFAGAGRGAYDALGNFTGTGDYTVAIVTTADVDRVSRASTSARLGWQFGRSAAWRGSRAEFDFETEARRRGELALSDPVLAPRAALDDPGLSRGSVLQRLEVDLAPGSRAAAFRLRAERRVTADRSFSNFAQAQDVRNASLRWRVQPAPGWSGESEARWRRGSARQALAGGGSLDRGLEERVVATRITFTPGAALRAAWVLDGGWSRPTGSAAEWSRTLRLGPDLGVAAGARGHVDLSLRRGFAAGPRVQTLLPTADPAGMPVWEASGRFDYRVHENTTAGISVTASEHAGRRALVNGRAEVRAFF